MNLRQLKYFCRVFELQNITRAADSLCVAQPALSQQMALLEDSLGVQLLNRGPKGVQPTDAGAILYRQAQIILRQVDITSRLLTHDEEQVTGSVSIAVASSTARVLVLPLIKKVKKHLPGVILEIINIPSSELINHVIHGRVDMALPPDQEAVKGIQTMPILVETLFLLSNRSWGVAPGAVSLETISDMPLILPRLPNKVRSRIEHAFLSKRQAYNLYAEASTAAVIIPAVSEGMAATILPYSAAGPEIAAGEIVANPLDIGLAREVVLCYGHVDHLSPAANAVITMLKDLIKELVQEKIWKGCKLLY